MSRLRDFGYPIIISIIVLTLVSVPYLIALRAAGTDFEFGGFLFNPLDGNSYLAKMYQGLQGEWRFKLPYTADPGDGAYLFLFYLALGHLARILHLPTLTVFHLTRLCGTVLLLFALWRYFGAIFPQSTHRKWAFALAALGSGMGWLIVVTGELTSDFWVAEAYPFLSAYANPHFPISLALMLGLLMPPLDRGLQIWQWVWIGAGALALSVISPFGVIVVLLVLGVYFFWGLIQRKESWELFWRIFCVALLGLPLLFYDLWATAADPVLAGWDAQNLTPSPPFWDLLVSLSPVLLLTMVAAWGLLRKNRRGFPVKDCSVQNVVSLLLWVISGLILMYLPWDLQRRFMLGLYIPLSGLAILGLDFLAVDQPRRFRVLAIIMFFLALPTNLIILLAGFQAAQTHDLQIYLTQPESDALTWIENNTAADALILAGPDMGLFIPARTGRRVIYGHPFETVDAEQKEAEVTLFFSGEMTNVELQDFISEQGVDYVFMGPRERELGVLVPPASWQVVFQTADVILYIQELP